MKFRYRHNLAGTQVERESGILRGVQVCAMGAAKGHGVLVDRITIDSLNELAGKTEDGVRLKFNPDTFQHGDGAVIGRLLKGSFKVDAAGVLRADAEIQKSYPRYEYVMDLAEKQPNTVALSVEFDGADEIKDGVAYARPTGFETAMLVDAGAATSGLFSKLEEKTITEPNPNEEGDDTVKGFTEEQIKQLQGVITEANRPLSERLAKLEDGSKADKEPDTTGMSAEEIEEERLCAGVGDKETGVTAWRKIHAFRAAADKPMTTKAFFAMFRQAGGLPVSGSPSTPKREDGNGGGKHPFMLKVDELFAVLGNRAEAMRQASKNFRALHTDYQKSQFAAHQKRTLAASGQA